MAIITGTSGSDTLDGTADADTIDGLAGDDRLWGQAGNDTITGAAGNDRLYGQGGDDKIYGGDGDDWIETADGADVVDGGAGFDTLYVNHYNAPYGFSFTLNGAAGSDGSRAINMEKMFYDGGEGNDVITGADGDDNISGAYRNDILNGAAGNDLLFGGTGDDVLRGGAGADYLGGDDDPWAAPGTDTASYYTSAVGVVVDLTTGIGAGGDAQGDRLDRIETVSGSQGNDSLAGNSGANTLQGWNGNDVLAGGAGKDTLFGYAGADRFVFGSIGDSVVGANADRITDFSHAQGDRIDLSAIDAKTGVAGDQAFTFIGTALYTGVAGQLRCASDGVITAIGGDVDGDGVSDFHIRLTGQIGLTAADFVL
ncbi:calcium-binding protein [Mycobacterium sp. KBS0706]|uniref:calcium-binding protein n=1 Tax=Mycobacterium sp. KBS0706 TaxID=2578109 RepID=UPI00110FDF36|nr:calcium-binding protein [Mycobacterium sp. KBS0706]TSD85486.1 calcium-binding protein [Mycobacterium sp. KBS0706]